MLAQRSRPFPTPQLYETDEVIRVKNAPGSTVEESRARTVFGTAVSLRERRRKRKVWVALTERQAPNLRSEREDGAASASLERIVRDD